MRFCESNDITALGAALSKDTQAESVPRINYEIVAYGAPNKNKLKFCLMWANHDWINLFLLASTCRVSDAVPGLGRFGAV